jgi:hypothetical protein
MTAVSRGFDLLVGLAGVAAWGLAVYAFGSRLISPTVGGLLAVALVVGGLGTVISWQLQDARARSLGAGRCPRCHTAIAAEHKHRAWEPDRAEWTPPMLVWDCASCGFSQSEVWACPSCPAPD